MSIAAWSLPTGLEPPAEVALAVMLVAGAGWLVRSFENLRDTDRDFIADNRLILNVSLLGPNFRENTAVHAAPTGDGSFSSAEA